MEYIPEEIMNCHNDHVLLDYTLHYYSNTKSINTPKELSSSNSNLYANNARKLIDYLE